jgi:predicted RNA-binding protein associated with RNAse of E/G family
MERFTPGATVMVRDVIFGRPYAAWPQRVVADDGYELTTLLRPGTNGIAPATWIRWLQGKDPRDRDGFLPELAGRRLEVGEWTWRRTTWLSFLYPDRYFGVKPMWEGSRFVEWYIDFQVPYERTAVGVDSCDLHLDLVVLPDFSYRWKDEDEYAHARSLGLVTDACHKKVDEARQQILAMVEERQGPFAESWDLWAPDPAWPLPEMPAGALSEPAAAGLSGLPGEPTAAHDAASSQSVR